MVQKAYNRILTRAGITKTLLKEKVKKPENPEIIEIPKKCESPK